MAVHLGFGLSAAFARFDHFGSPKKSGLLEHALTIGCPYVYLLICKGVKSWTDSPKLS